MIIRKAEDYDQQILTDILVEAFTWTDESRLTREEILADPDCSHYVEGWPRPGDVGVVAVDPDSDKAVGAAWLRTFPSDDPGHGYVADEVPELSMAVKPAHRGRGLGETLLAKLLVGAGNVGHRAVSLSVEDGNDAARRLYDRSGFVAVGREGGADVMVRHLD